MNKRGMQAIEIIGIIVIMLIVVIVVAVLFRQQATKGQQGVQQFTEQTNVEAFARCNNPILGSSCVSTSDCVPDKGGRRRAGVFSDCKESGKVCCEFVST